MISFVVVDPKSPNELQAKNTKAASYEGAIVMLAVKARGTLH